MFGNWNPETWGSIPAVLVTSADCWPLIGLLARGSRHRWGILSATAPYRLFLQLHASGQLCDVASSAFSLEMMETQKIAPVFWTNNELLLLLSSESCGLVMTILSTSRWHSAKRKQNQSWGRPGQGCDWSRPDFTMALEVGLICLLYCDRMQQRSSTAALLRYHFSLRCIHITPLSS